MPRAVCMGRRGPPAVPLYAASLTPVTGRHCSTHAQGVPSWKSTLTARLLQLLVVLDRALPTRGGQCPCIHGQMALQLHNSTALVQFPSRLPVEPVARPSCQGPCSCQSAHSWLWPLLRAPDPIPACVCHWPLLLHWYPQLRVSTPQLWPPPLPPLDLEVLLRTPTVFVATAA